ncbi:hypothetical protein GUITHDRAFT_116118 [Guillardia theta CCMP2712]|uniref:C3H1-type domain-containing protein n=1 Tax=Guillardia theta (strain CCMP2712) TaxID=905079 RepID=L1IPS7_GUITC|nr:hypothetical protein GUITHDRAFT_116118 [Guillardia theta CCMP2712]EKX37810.1 hypothetical protein GUITHDRAFT_116118 [Guillardia theta CCMP2712]|eukprot:XP_005824790.1 hypothetical protein GUITHDRAFT_116118 [Guillardia theta CCMP2712]
MDGWERRVRSKQGASSLFSKIDAKGPEGTQDRTTGAWVVKSESNELTNVTEDSRENPETWNPRRPTSVFSTTEETSYRDLDKDIEVLDDNPYDRICTQSKHQDKTSTREEVDDDVIFIGSCGSESTLLRESQRFRGILEEGLEGGREGVRSQPSDPPKDKKLSKSMEAPATSHIPSRTSQATNKTCFQFSQTGKCSRGLHCRFKHEVPDHIKNPERYLCYEVDWTEEEDPRKNGEAAAATFELLRSQKRISEEELQQDQARKEQETLERQARLESKKAKTMCEIRQSDMHAGSEQENKKSRSKKIVKTSKLSFIDE